MDQGTYSGLFLFDHVHTCLLILDPVWIVIGVSFDPVVIN